LLEGSARREGTKYIKNKGEGLMWATWFVGPILAAQRLAGKGEGEASCLRQTLAAVLRDVVDPLKLREKTLALLDSLHGDGPTLEQLESEDLKYVVGANKLDATRRLLEERGEHEWRERGARSGWGWSESAVCACWIQCEGWEKKRLLIGRRWRENDELSSMPYHYNGVITNLGESDVAHMLSDRVDYLDAIWKLYDLKGGCEDRFKDLLEDLSGHYPPCEELIRNRGYYSLLGLAHTLSCGMDLIGNQSDERGSTKRLDGGERRRAKPRRTRLWRLRRRFFCFPARVAYHARTVRVQLLGSSQEWAAEILGCFRKICGT
jgi:hypothetical protein